MHQNFQLKLIGVLSLSKCLLPIFLEQKNSFEQQGFSPVSLTAVLKYLWF